MPMVIKYTVCDVEIPYPGSFPYISLFTCLGFLHGFLQGLIIVLTYLGLFTFTGLCYYPVKDLILNLECFY